MDLLRHLRYFVAVAEELHFGRAAARLHMAQPPLSQRIRGLERELGVRLFDRTSRRVELTPAGRLLLDEARGLLARADALTATMERLRGGELGELRAGVPPEIGASVLAELVTSFRAASPDVRLELREATTGRQLEGLAAGELDVGVVRHPVRLGSLERGPSLAKDVGVLLAADGAPDGEVELSGLAGRELVLFARDDAPDLYDELLATCRAHGFAPGAVHHAGNAGFASGLVLAGAVAFAAGDAPVPPGVAWRPLAGHPLRWRVSTVWRTGTSGRAVEAFAEAATAALAGVGGWRPVALPETPARRIPRPASGLLA